MAQDEISFLARKDFWAGRDPTSVVVGDFNGDKIPDLAVNNGMILLGNGDGTFAPARPMLTEPAGSTTFLGVAQSIAVADFNGDEILDIAFSSGFILLGNGDGTFRRGGRFQVGRFPKSIAVGDFNGDNFLDVAAANATDRFGEARNAISIALGNGDGTFQPTRLIPVGTNPFSIAVGDFNGDEILDLAVAKFVIGPPIPPEGTVYVMLGNGDGTFQPPQGLGVVGIFVTVGDFDGDEIPDLAISGVGPYSDRVYVLLGNGDGSFRRAPDLGISGGPVAIGDFNADKIQDLAVAVAGDDALRRPIDAVYVLLGNGDGTFRPAQEFGVGGTPHSIAVSDFNGDEVPDLVTANWTTSNISILLGSGDGTFLSAPNFRVPSSPLSIVVADFDGDAILDVATSNANVFRYTSGTVSVLLGNGDGSFRAAQNFQAGRRPTSLHVGDFNGDEIPDLVVANSTGPAEGDSPTNTVSVLLGKPDGTFEPVRSFQVGRNPFSVTVGDFNGDDVQDLAVISGGFGPRAQASLSLLFGNGDGMFQAAQTYNVAGHPSSIMAADFNGDELQDLVMVNSSSNTVSIMLGNGDGTFGPAREFAAGRAPLALAVADLNGDAVPDLAVASAVANSVAILLGNGDGTFGPARNFAAGSGPSPVIVGDFNGDDVLDLAVRNNGTSQVSVLIGRGDGTFGSPQDFGAGSSPGGIAVGDFDGDERLDMVVANGPSNNVSILLNNTPRP